MARESIRGAGRDASGPHGYTFRLEQFLRAKGSEGATLDELVTVAIDERWISRNFALVRYANRLNSGAKSRTDSALRWTPEHVMREGRLPNAVRYCLSESLHKGKWAERRNGRWYATGRGVRIKPQGGWTIEEVTATPEQISRDVIERELIRVLKPHMHQKTHKLTPGEWELLSKWVQLSVVGWQP